MPVLQKPGLASASSEDKQLVPLIRRGSNGFIAVLWVLGALAAALAVWMLIENAETETRSTAAIIDQYARRNIEIGDFVADEYARYLDRRGGVQDLRNDPAASVEFERLHSRLPAGSASIFVLPDGSVSASSGMLPPPDVNFSDRRWFKAHMSEGLKTYIGPAIHSRVVDQILYTYGKTYEGADGRILGMINLGIPSTSVIGLLPGSSGMAMALVQHEGNLVAAQPMQPERLGQPFSFGGAPPEAITTRLASVFDRMSVTTVKNLPEYQIYAIAAVPLLVVLEPAIWSIFAGTIVLALLTWALLSVSRVAERKSREVEQALADNRVLFQEVHHRVKNNLQIIASLIRLQTDKLPPELQPIMEQTTSRVRAIAMVHEQIYATSSPSVVELDQFLKKLLRQLEASLLAAGGATLSLQLQPISLALDQAVPVALLATEAITNAMKHGVGPKGGSIVVALSREGPCNILRITDDGDGMDPESKGGLGTKIMSALAQQINGSYTIKPAHPTGTSFVLSWAV